MADSRRRASDDRALLDAEYLVVWFVVILVVASIAGSVVLYGDDVRDATPDSDLEASFDAENQSVTVEHAGGEPIRDRETRRLSVVVVDSNTSATERIAWAEDDRSFSDRGTGYPISSGDSITVDDPTVDADGDGDFLDAEESVGFRLDAEDSVRVVWEGVGRGGDHTTETLLNATLAPASGDGTIRFQVEEN